MRSFTRFLGALVLCGSLLGSRLTVDAQDPSPAIEALVEEIARLKKQLAQEKARSDQLAAEVRLQAEQALLNERRALEEARRAEAQAQEALARLKKGQAGNQDEIERLRKELEATQRALLESKTLTARLTQEFERAQVINDTEKRALLERIKTVELRLTETEKALRDNPGAVAPPREKNPPREALEGKVSKVTGKLLQLSIGADAGLERGQTLELFRLEGKPQYLGTVRIVDVTPREAVAEPVGRMTGEPQVGDRVSSRLP